MPSPTSPEHARPRAAVVVNPTKFADVAAVRRSVSRQCHELGWDEPLWLETTADDTGTGQTRQALAEGVDLVCPLGGDGTVREVGAALVGTGTPLGLLPGGTGNLLARNLGLPIDSLEAALSVALSGEDVAIDSCRLRLVRPTTDQLVERLRDEDDEAANVDLDDAVDAPTSEDRVEQHTFLVMAGLGFDAEVMASADEKLKTRVGWLAYLVAGLRHLKGPQFTVLVQVDGERVRRRTRGVLVGNVGELQGGVQLLPGLRADDGQLAAAVISPKGVVGWGAVVADLTTRGRLGHHTVDHLSGRSFKILSSKPVELEMDGDTLGNVISLEVDVDPGSLLVRLPRKR